MKKNVGFVCLLLALIVVSEIKAQDSEENLNVEIFEGMTWYLDKTEALDLARAQDKQVFLLWGRHTCANCKSVRTKLGQSPLKEIIDEHYILWFCDCDEYNRYSLPVADYISDYVGSITLPAICIINTFDVTVARSLKTKNQSVEDLLEMLNRHVSNDLVISDLDECSVGAYVSGNNLMLQSGFAKELISVYTMTGSLIDQFTKNDYLYSKHMHEYPKGILLVSSSSGWTRKIVVR